MKIVLKALAAAVLSLATLSAHATLITSTADKSTGSVTTSSFLDVTHTLTNYSKDLYTLTDSTLLVYLRDTSGNETFEFKLGFDGASQTFDVKDSTNKSLKNIPNGVSAAQFEFHLDPATALIDLADGALTFRITALTGSFSFDGSVLTANADDVVKQEEKLPEPMSLGLFAIGLLGFGVARRRMK